MAEFEEGAQVRILTGKGEGITGEIFWWGESKYGDGMRAGVAGDDGEKYWVDEEDLELWDGEPSQQEPESDDADEPVFAEGDRVQVTSGKERGAVGEIFWWGESKFGDGMRAGIATDDGEKVWADAEDLAAFTGQAAAPEPATGNHLAGLKIVLTGNFDSYDRKEATDVLERLGADVTSSVSGKTMVLIVGEDPGSKVQKAESRGIPLVGEAEMLAMIGGKTLDEVLQSKSATGSAEEDDDEVAASAVAPSMPYVDPRPRNAAFESHYDDSDQLHVTGEYVEGLRQGAWKEYWPNGQLKQDYEWARGLKHGHELDWTEDGTQVCEGENARHVRTGTWTWWHANGEYKHAYTYDEDGKAHGPYKWNTDDGEPRARGEFWHGEKDGDWEWRQEPNHERMTRSLRRGRKHGEDAAWYPGGQLAYRHFYFDAYKHGDWETYDADGSPRFKGSYRFGIPVGEHRYWDDDGDETSATFVDGLSLVPNEKAIAKLVKKIEKAKDNYAKEDALEIVSWDQRSALVYHLWKHDHYDVASDPELWEKITEGLCGLFSGQDVIDFLQGASNEGWAGHLPYWSSHLDKLVAHVYARDPEPIDAAWESLPDLNRKGVAFVLARFGTEIGDALSDEIGALAKKHATDYGISDRIWWPSDEEEGLVEERKLFSDLRRTPTPLFDEMIEWFGGSERWVEALMPYALEEADHSVSRVSFTVFRPIVESASTELMIKLCTGISLDNQTHELLWEALWSWREDDAATMTEIALGVVDDGLRKWPLVCAAVLKHADEGSAVPGELVEAFMLDNESPTYSSQWMELGDLPEEFRSDPHYVAAYRDMSIGCAVPRNQRVHEALRVLDSDQLRAVFDRYAAAEEGYSKCKLSPYLYLVDDASLWKDVVGAAEEYDYGTEPRVAWGFGNIGLAVVPLLEKALEAAPNKAKPGWRQAIVCALSRAAVDGEEIPQKYDEHVRFDAYPKKDDYYYKFLQPFVDRLAYELPRERAEKIILAGLQTNMYWRALGAVSAHPTEAVLGQVFTRLLELESTMDHEQKQAFTQMLKGLENPRDWAKWILQSGGGAGCRDALRDAVGYEEFEALEQELATEGVEKAKELDDIDKLVALTEKSDGGEPLYLLRRLDEVGDSLNVIGGAAPGVDADRWPVSGDDEPLTHLFTLDLKSMPKLGARYDAQRTLSVFCLQPDYNEAWEPYNEWTAIVFSSQEQLDAAGEPPEEIDATHEASFEPVEVQADLSDDDVRKAVYRVGARVLGDPIWLQEEGHWGDFIMQFDESFSYMNLGDSGVMYVFGDTAFWQCY